MSYHSKEVEDLNLLKYTFKNIKSFRKFYLLIKLLFFSLTCYFTGARQEQDIFVRLIDSVTKQVSTNLPLIHYFHATKMERKQDKSINGNILLRSFGNIIKISKERTC